MRKVYHLRANHVYASIAFSLNHVYPEIMFSNGGIRKKINKVNKVKSEKGAKVCRGSNWQYVLYFLGFWTMRQEVMAKISQTLGEETLETSVLSENQENHPNRKKVLKGVHKVNKVKKGKRSMPPRAEM